MTALRYQLDVQQEADLDQLRMYRDNALSGGRLEPGAVHRAWPDQDPAAPRPR
jgi:hypothetical protein